MVDVLEGLDNLHYPRIYYSETESYDAETNILIRDDIDMDEGASQEVIIISDDDGGGNDDSVFFSDMDEEASHEVVIISDDDDSNDDSDVNVDEAQEEIVNDVPPVLIHMAGLSSVHQ